ncbi:MAG: phosphotransferase, partial [Actinomycetes bacterium]
FSPKNVLVGDSDLWVIDFEVAHYGDPAFDLAFLLSHLLLKAVHRPVDAVLFGECAMTFGEAYRGCVPPPLRPEWPYVLGHTGCLLLARVAGKSPAEYLDPAGRSVAHELGRRLLVDPPSTIERAYDRLAGMR